MFNLRCLIPCVLAFVTTSQSAHVIDRDGVGFLQNVLRYFGENKSISTENLEDLLLIISARRTESINKGNPLAKETVSCLHLFLILLLKPFQLVKNIVLILQVFNCYKCMFINKYRRKCNLVSKMNELISFLLFIILSLITSLHV